MDKCNILGVEVNVTNMRETVEYIEMNMEESKGKYICVSNVHTTVMSHEDKEYRNIQNGAFLTLPDGKPLSIVSKMKGFKNAQRVTGPDLMEELFKISEEKGYSHYFYGSTDETLDKLKSRLKMRFPKLNIAGAYSPPFRQMTETEDVEIIESINDLKPDFVWIGLGAPKQEIWMNAHRDKIQSLMIGVGAGFEYHADTLKRAPAFMQKMSLEWLYRLYQEPGRLFKRYARTNFKFLFYITIFYLLNK